MLNKISRRQFIGASLVLCALPARLFAERSGNVVLRFAVMSDVHYSGLPLANEVKRFNKSLAFMYDYSSKQKHSTFDALLVAGDMSNHGTSVEIVPFKTDIDNGLRPETKTVICMGNHEFYGGSKPLWEKVFGVPANTHTVIGGYHFLALSPEKGTCRNGDYAYALDWLKRELDAATADAPDKPVFLIQHYHISETVYGSLNGDNWGTNDLYELLQNYPRVVDFSGHSHYPITDPRSAWQSKFTAFGTGTLSYFEMQSGVYNKFPSGHRNVGQFYVVEILDDNSIVLKPYDLISGSFYDTVYTVAEAGNIAKYLYTDERYKTAKSPRWQPETAVSVTDIKPEGATFTFPQAVDDIAVHSYRLNFKIKENDTWRDDVVRYEWSNYFYRPMPATMTIPSYALEPDSSYKLQITALNCFQKETDKTIDIEFVTLKNPDETFDRKAEFPAANVLDISFSADVSNAAPNGKDSKPKPVETFGKPTIVSATAKFNGVDDAYIIRFTDEDYSRLQRRITMAVKFKIEKFSDKQSATDIFANTESGGYAFEINHKSKRLEFWCNVNGNYVIVASPFTAGEFHTAFGVYNGKEVKLYIDGKETATKKASGLIHYPKQNAAKAFCVGGDINNNGKPVSYYEGEIQYAKVYGWALQTKQIENLTNGKLSEQ